MQPGLTDVPETMLWTLHNRASEAAREDGCIRDEKCLEIYHSLHYDYEKHFGRADSSHGVRSQLFDEHIQEFVDRHPDAVIINLGEGLETQRYRVNDGPGVLWVTIDLPDAIAIRERFIQPDERHLHIARNALDTSWFDEIPQDRPCFIAAQGLFMYFSEEDMWRLVKAMAKRFPGAILMFDYLNKILSKRTLSPKGWMKTKAYRTPKMPWGVDRRELEPTFSRWLGQHVNVHNVTFLFPRGLERRIIPFMERRVPGIANKMPGICWLQLPEKA